MLNIKKGGRSVFQAFLSVILFIFIAGCTEPGPRALLDGDRLLQEGKAEAAISRLTEAVGHLPQNAKAWNHLGLAYHQVGNVDKASQCYQKALSFDRNFSIARFNLGCLYLEQNHTAEAIAQLTIYVQLDSKKMIGWVKLGTAQLRHAGHLAGADKTKMLDAARKSFEASLALGSNADAHNAIGLIEVQRGKPRDAVRHFNSALAVDPKHGGALLNLAVVYHGPLHDPRAALQRYREYLASQPVSNQYREVESMARRLDLELNPPPVVAATTPAAPPVQTSPPSTQIPKPRETKAESPAPKLSPKPEQPSPVTKTPPVISPRTATPSKPIATPQPEAPVETVKLPDEPVAAPAQDQPPSVKPTPAPAPEPAVAEPAATKPETASTAEPAKQPEEKKSLLKRMNPATWFKGKPEESKTTPPPQPAEPVTAVTNVTPKASPPPRQEPNFVRYRYISPTKPKAGNRAAAMSFFNEAMGAQRTGNFARAMNSYRAALKSDPAFFEAYYNFGLAAFQAGDFPASLHAYENALAISPDSVDARYNFALALQRANFPVDAAKELEKVLTRSPNEVRAHLSAANLYAQVLGDPVQARSHYQQVLKLDPHHSQSAAIRNWLRSNQ